MVWSLSLLSCGCAQVGSLEDVLKKMEVRYDSLLVCWTTPLHGPKIVNPSYFSWWDMKLDHLNLRLWLQKNEKNSGWDDLIFIPPGKSHTKHFQEVANAWHIVRFSPSCYGCDWARFAAWSTVSFWWIISLLHSPLTPPPFPYFPPWGRALHNSEIKWQYAVASFFFLRGWGGCQSKRIGRTRKVMRVSVEARLSNLVGLLSFFFLIFIFIGGRDCIP